MSRSISPSPVVSQSKSTIHLPPLRLPKTECLTVDDIRRSNYETITLKRPIKLPRPQHRTCVEKPRGVHDFFNLMWDPYIVRGSTFKTIDQDRIERCKSKQDNLNSKEARKDKKLFKNFQRKVGGICPWPPEIPDPERPSLRSQCERFLIESIQEIAVVNQGSQTPCCVVKSDSCPPKPKPKFDTGINVATQIECFDLFDELEMIGCIAETLAEKISEQSLVEMMEEEELLALNKIKTAFKQKIVDDKNALVELAEREQRKAYYDNVMAFDDAKQAEGEIELQDIVERNCFARSAMDMVRNKVWATLQKMGCLIDRDQLNIERWFIPWLNHKVDCEVENMTMPTAIIDDIVEEATEKRLLDILEPLRLSFDIDFLPGSKKNSEQRRTTLYEAEFTGESDYDEDIKRIKSNNYTLPK